MHLSLSIPNPRRRHCPLLLVAQFCPCSGHPVSVFILFVSASALRPRLPGSCRKVRLVFYSVRSSDLQISWVEFHTTLRSYPRHPSTHTARMKGQFGRSDPQGMLYTHRGYLATYALLSRPVRGKQRLIVWIAPDPTASPRRGLDAPLFTATLSPDPPTPLLFAFPVGENRRVQSNEGGWPLFVIKL